MKKWLPLIVFVVLLLGTAYFWLEPLWSFLSDRGEIEDFLLGIGSWGPLGLIILQALQISFFPIPSFFGMIGGFLFGFFPGLVYTQIGTFLGSLLAFFLAKMFGRPLVKRLVASKTMEMVDGIAQKRGIIFFLIYYWLPSLPKDAMCYVAGLTPLSYVSYAFVAFFGRLPGSILATLIGAGLWQFKLPIWGWITLFCFLSFGLAWAFFKRNEIKIWSIATLNKFKTPSSPSLPLVEKNFH